MKLYAEAAASLGQLVRLCDPMHNKDVQPPPHPRELKSCWIFRLHRPESLFLLLFSICVAV